MNWQEFFAMGGYALYVWTSYGICLLVLLINLIAPIAQRRHLTRQIMLKQKRTRL